MKGLVVVPAFNEDKVIARVLAEIPKYVGKVALDILVVNDGSADNTEEIAKKSRAIVVSHPINRGLGAALGTGFEYARTHDYDLLVTLDGDGQHDPAEIEKLILPIVNKEADFAVGTRVNQKGMPLSRKVLTYLASFATYIFTGVWTSDSQSGFRVFSKLAINKIRIEVDRMEVSSDFFYQSLVNKLKMAEIPIRPIYTEYSYRKGQNMLNSFNIIGKLALKRILR